MMEQEIYNWTIIQTYYSSPIHIEYLKNSNHNAQILLADLTNINPKTTKIKYWRNSDFYIREWIKLNIHLIKYQNIAIIEWDVLITQSLPEINITGLKCKNIHYPNKNWPWFKEISRLDNYKSYAIGIAPLGILFLNRSILYQWIDKEFDTIYQKDIFCKLRLPTILNSKKIKIETHHMPNVHWKKTNLTKNPGIYHPIKYNVPIK